MSEIPHVYIQDIAKYNGKEVCLKGWLFMKRGSGKISFLQFRDGTGIIQAVVVKGEVDDETFELSKKTTQECSIVVKGIVREDTRSKLGYEIGVTGLEIISESTDYPITPKEHGTGFLMENRHLWIRAKKQNAILRIRHEIIKAIRDYFDDNGFTLVDAPIFTPAACEGTSNLFEVDYFDDEKAYLTQSGQLYMEAAAMAVGKAYCFGPTFRAEKSKTRRHLTEFWMVEPEVAYNDLNDNMDLAEDFIEYVVQRVVKNKRFELELLERDVSKLENIKKPFPRITYDEAVEILKKKGKDFEYGNDFGADDETTISEEFDKPIMIYNWPANCKAFYFKKHAENPNLALGVDIIAPEGYGEIVGGGQREENIEVLLDELKKHNLPKEEFEWYLDVRRFGSVPHSGFGLGLERTVAWICKLHHVRETIPFPRLMDRIRP